MPWFQVDDRMAYHRKIVAAGNSAVGLWARAGAWCAGELTDGFVPDHMVQAMGTAAQARKLVQVGLWHRVDERGGYQFHEFTEEGRNPTKEAVLAERAYNRRKAALQRDKDLIEAIRKRDGDRCRYCGCLVNWGDRRGTTGATYDHIIPGGPNAIGNVVVACRGCNSRKNARSPEAAGMPLLPPKSMGVSSVSAAQGDEYQVGTCNEPGSDQEETKAHTTPHHTTPTSPNGDVTTSGAAAPSDFDRFWAAYPRRTGKGAAEKAWAKAAKAADPQRLIDAATHFAAARQDQDPRFTPHPATWLNQRRWEDEDQPPLRLVSGGYEPYQNPTDLNAYHEGLL